MALKIWKANKQFQNLSILQMKKKERKISQMYPLPLIYDATKRTSSIENNFESSP